ncbi:protein of unknown function [Kyrpidia spormannii]|uniref:Uncharacterized protein n=1 Tax=Kyrpidia spormannii TaxID=2055160 RepID=A0A6F9EBK7_9BACL|nr:protein of unknown function [Kyrpidia spormannii]
MFVDVSHEGSPLSGLLRVGILALLGIVGLIRSLLRMRCPPALGETDQHLDDGGRQKPVQGRYRGQGKPAKPIRDRRCREGQ